MKPFDEHSILENENILPAEFFSKRADRTRIEPLERLAFAVRQGFFWNSFVIVARIAALLDLFARALPQLYVSFAQSFPVFGTTREGEAVARLFDDIQLFSFSDNVLTKFCTEFLVLPVCDIQWRDLGEPTRVLKIITQTGLRPKWLDARSNDTHCEGMKIPSSE
jgi:mannose-1-phosphate guanylyltransferase